MFLNKKTAILKFKQFSLQYKRSKEVDWMNEKLRF